MIKVTWIFARTGSEYSASYDNIDDAIDRLEYLDANERTTRRCMPTDSGDVRQFENAEAAALRKRIYDA